MAVVVVAGAAISGCGGPVQAGTAVFVGDEAVPLERVQSQAGMFLDKVGGEDSFRAQGGDPAQLSREVVRNEVLHNLVSNKAAELGIVVTDAQIDAEIDASGGAEAILAQSGLDLEALRTQIHDNLAAVQIGQRVAPTLAVTVDLVGIGTSRAEAEQAARVLAAGGPEADALAAGPNAQRTVFQAGSFPSGLGSVVLGVPAGTAGAFQPSPNEANWVAFRVVERRSDVPADPAAPAVTEQQAIQVGIREAQLSGEVAGIRVNPRYGQWDPVSAQVVPDGQQLGEVLLPAVPTAA